MSYHLDSHGEELLEQYRERIPIYKRIEEMALKLLQQALQEQGVYVTSIEHRIKEEKSLAEKLELKGGKYQSLDDVTDILGLRIITFYTDDVDKVAAIAKNIFQIDWENSQDKRKAHQLNSFGYNSLHYICRLPKGAANDSDVPELEKYRFELQMRTALQHVWSTIEHDTGYKAEVKIPNEYRRQFSRLAGMLELIDDEFSRLRTALTDYRRQVQSLVASGRLDDVPLDLDSFKSYLNLHPFKRLNHRIAATNQAEIVQAPLLPFLPVMQTMFRFETLGDVERFIAENEDDAYNLAVSQLALTDIDIISEHTGPLYLCIIHILKKGWGHSGIKQLYDTINGEQPSHEALADMVIKQASSLSFMCRKGS